MIDITRRLRELADQLEALDEKSAAPEPARPWPPKGVAIEIESSGYWRRWVSAGNGWFYDQRAYSLESPLKDSKWRYARAEWDIAPECTSCWIVTSLGESMWASNRMTVGQPWGHGTIVHVEYRDDV